MFMNKLGNSYRNIGGEEYEIFEVDNFGQRVFRPSSNNTKKVTIEETYNNMLKIYPSFKGDKKNV